MQSSINKFILFSFLGTSLIIFLDLRDKDISLIAYPLLALLIIWFILEKVSAPSRGLRLIILSLNILLLLISTLLAGLANMFIWYPESCMGPCRSYTPEAKVIFLLAATSLLIADILGVKLFSKILFKDSR